MVLIIFFSINAAYIGTRLGILWELLGEKHEEFHQAHVRDPYPLIAEKAGLAKGPRLAKILRTTASGITIPLRLENFKSIV